MARISTYINDVALTGNDRVIGTDGGSNSTVNYTLDQIAAFVGGEVLPELENGAVVLFNDGEFIESFITNNITTATFSHAYTNQSVPELGLAITFSDATTINVGANVRNIFTEPILQAGVRVIFTDATGNSRFVREVASVDTTARTITITEPVIESASFSGNTVSNGSNVLEFVRNDGITGITIEDPTPSLTEDVDSINITKSVEIVTLAGDAGLLIESQDTTDLNSNPGLELYDSGGSVPDVDFHAIEFTHNDAAGTKQATGTIATSNVLGVSTVSIINSDETANRARIDLTDNTAITRGDLTVTAGNLNVTAGQTNLPGTNRSLRVGTTTSNGTVVIAESVPGIPALVVEGDADFNGSIKLNNTLDPGAVSIAETVRFEGVNELVHADIVALETAAVGTMGLRLRRPGSADDLTLADLEDISLTVVSNSAAGTGRADVSFGDIRITTVGKGLQFGTAAANILDDYEEGTWVPTSTQITAGLPATARYTKIGNSVTVHLSVSSTTIAASGSVVIGGLPFSGIGTEIAGGVWNSTGDAGIATALLTLIVLRTSTGGIGTGALLNGDSEFHLTLTYETNA